MKKITFFLILSVSCLLSTYSQQKITIQNGSKTQFYDTLKDALNKAISGDTLYLPGATMMHNEDIIIDKKLSIIGVGWDNDAIEGLKPTLIKNNDGGYTKIVLSNGADGSFISGCIFGGLSLERNTAVQNITLFRNLLRGSIELGDYTCSSKFVYIIENRMDGMVGISGNNSSNCIIRNNCMPNAGISFFIHSKINNNVMSSVGQFEFCDIENNCILSHIAYTLDVVLYGCTFNNNAFNKAFTIPNYGSSGQPNNNSGKNNIDNVAFSEELIGGVNNHPNYYELKAGSSLKNAGTDGTDIGMYGGSNPYKKGAVPMNPHIDKFSVSDATNTDGKLKIDIQVSAQTR